MEEETTTETNFQDTILSYWMQDVLEDEVAKNVYQFSKRHDFEEQEFYEYFSSLEHINEQVWVTFLTNTIHLLDENEAYHEYDEKNKLIAFYFTFFEVLTLNRSYVLATLPKSLKELHKLKDLEAFRKEFKVFMKQIVKAINSNPISEKIAKFSEPILEEASWVQFLFFLNYWVNDKSKGFEKTDVLIEKTIKASTELLSTKPLESLVDLGKFLWKEHK